MSRAKPTPMKTLSLIAALTLLAAGACSSSAGFECETTLTCACSADANGRASNGCDNVPQNECSYATCSRGTDDFVCGGAFEAAGTACTGGACDGEGQCVPEGVGGAGGSGGETGAGGGGGVPFAVTPAVAVGSNHTCALRADGRVFCWGGRWPRSAGRWDHQRLERAGVGQRDLECDSRGRGLFTRVRTARDW